MYPNKKIIQKLFFYLTLLVLVSCAGKGVNEKGENFESVEVPDLAKHFGIGDDLKDSYGVDTAYVDEEDDGSSESPPPPPPEPEKKPKPEKKVKSAKKKEYGFPNNRFAGQKIPFKVGETTELDMSYFGVKAGSVRFEVLPDKKINDRDAYHFKIFLKSAKLFDLFYRVDDYMQSYMDKEGLFPYSLEMVLDESRQKKKTLEIFDHKVRMSRYWSYRKHIEKGVQEDRRTTEFPEHALDTLGSLYYLRTFPMNVGDVIKFPVVADARVFYGSAHVLRKEKIEVAAGEFNTVVVKPETRFDGKLRKTGDIFLWFTDDDRHLLVKVKAKIKIGALYAEATEVKP